MHAPTTQECPVLVVDLDGTLLRTDMLHESFWAAFAQKWATPFIAVRALMKGRSHLKHKLSSMADIDVGLLPYNQEVIAYAHQWRGKGGKVVLATASHQIFAEKIAAYVGIFDEVYGSSGNHNLKGRHKANFLEGKFGKHGFAYIGDSSADLPVWEKASKIITVNPTRSLRQRSEALNRDTVHLQSASSSFSDYLRSLRPHQWLKNLLVFLPMLAAHQLNLLTWWHSLLAFISFSLIASSVYVLNDLLDLPSDRAHPRKRRRPFASGNISITHGIWMFMGALAGGLTIAFSLGGLFVLTMLAYYAVTTAYSLTLKRHLIIDICTLALLYTMRIMAGGVATDIPLSVWLLAFSLFFFLSLAAVKRQAELVDGVKSGAVKAYGRGYHTDDLPLVSQMAVASGYVSVLVMALYVNSAAIMALYHYPSALWGICLVLLYWISRMVMIAHRGNMHDDPVVFAVKDRVSQICLALIISFAVVGAVL